MRTNVIAFRDVRATVGGENKHVNLVLQIEAAAAANALEDT